MPSSSSNNSPLKSHISKQTVIKATLIAVIVAALLGYICWDVITNGPLMQIFAEGNQEKLQATIASWGIFAPLLYILLQITQTVIAPIPGQVVGGIGGYLFGGWGILWTLIGTLIGCYIVFRLARRFGRPLLEKIFKKSAVANFDFIINAKSASFIIFAIFLLPGFPDDIVCYIAGLTNLPIRRLVFLVALGRLPTIVLTNVIGSGVGENLTMVAVASVVGVLILGLATWKREWLMQVLKGSASGAKQKIARKKAQTHKSKTRQSEAKPRQDNDSCQSESRQLGSNSHQDEPNQSE